MADEEFGRQIPFGFLEKVKDDFLKNYGETGKNAAAMSMQRVYGCAPHATHRAASRRRAAGAPAQRRYPRARRHCFEGCVAGATHALTWRVAARSGELKKTMEYAMAHPEEINKVAKVQTQVAEVKEIMMQNIEKVPDRGEKLELLVDKTENLRYQADQFQKGGKALRNKMWWQNVKMKLLVALIVSIVIVSACPTCHATFLRTELTRCAAFPRSHLLLCVLRGRCA